MRVLVTGACGLLGTELSLQLRRAGHYVLGLDNLSRYDLLGEVGIRAQSENEKALEAAGVEFINSDIRYPDLGSSFDAIVHSAAQVCHSRKNDDPFDDYEVNIGGTLRMLEHARTRSVPLLFISSAKLYGENVSDLPVDETTPIGDQTHITFFGASKAAADLFAQMYARKYDMHVGVLRPGCFTGRWALAAAAQNWLPYLVHCISRDLPYTIYGYGGKQVRDLLHVSDLANACLLWLTQPSSGVWNIGGGPDRAINLDSAVTWVEERLGKTAVVEYALKRPGDIRCLVMDNDKFIAQYGWRPTMSLEAIFDDVVEAFR